MLNFIIVHLARAYFLYAFIAQLGVLQVVAARCRWTGLSIGNYLRRPGWGYALGIPLVVGAYVWFFSSYPEIFQPGPAGAELTFLFTLAGVLAIVSTLLLAEVKRIFSRSRDTISRGSGKTGAAEEVPYQLPEAGRPVALALGPQTVPCGVFSGDFLLPAEAKERFPSVCIVSGPDVQKRVLRQMAEELTRAGIAVLITNRDEKPLSYPEILALLPTAISFLSNHPQLDSANIGALGLDVGGDVILRSASTDRRVKAVVAVGPLLFESAARPGLNILREMTYGQAIRWARFRERAGLVSQLGALDHASKLRATPALLFYGGEDGLIPESERRVIAQRLNGSVELRIIPGETHTTLFHNEAVMRDIARWFAERLGRGA